MKTLGDHLERYLALRRSLGFQLNDVARQLGKLVVYLEQQGQTHISTAGIASWITSLDVSLSTRTGRFGMVRHFAAYLQTIDPGHEVPPRNLFTGCNPRKLPFIYTDEQIQQLLKAALQIPAGDGFRGMTMATLLGLLAVTGMRLGECLALNVDDVDLNNGVLTIVKTKFRKSRLIPIHPSTRQQIHEYAQWRRRRFPNPVSPSFLVSNEGTRLWKGNVRITFRQLLARIGLRQLGESPGPRLHDLRHTFAVRTLSEWYRADRDVETRLPMLATYLGHTHVSGTYWYLTGTPELLQLVAARMDRAVEGEEP